MSRQYIDLSCGCQVSCEGGGGLIPCGNDDSNVCESYRYIDEHFFCSICEECVVCYDHINCSIYPGGVE